MIIGTSVLGGPLGWAYIRIDIKTETWWNENENSKIQFRL